MNITEQKAFRRQRLAALMDELSQSKLAELTKIDAAYLYQMAKGKGDSARGVSDAKVSLIEARTGRLGWFSPPSVMDTDKAKKKGRESPGWTDKLTDKQLLASALVMDHLGHMNDAQCDALIALMEGFAAGHKSRKARHGTKHKEHA